MKDKIKTMVLEEVIHKQKAKKKIGWSTKRHHGRTPGEISNFDQGSMGCADIFRCTKCKLLPVHFQHASGVMSRGVCRGLTFLHAKR